MARKTLNDLGWDARRITLLLRQTEWQTLEAKALIRDGTLADIVATAVVYYLLDPDAWPSVAASAYVADARMEGPAEGVE